MDNIKQPLQDALQDELKQARARILQLETSLRNVQLSVDALNRTNAHYLDLAWDIVVQLDTQGKITMTNGKGYQLLGYSADELIGQNWFQTCLPQVNVDQVYSVYLKLMTGSIADVEDYENEILTKSGEYRFISWHNTLLKNESGNITGCLSAGIDITESKQTQNTLRERGLTLSKVLEIAHVGSWEWDVLTNSLEFSPEVYKIYDISPDEFNGNISSLYDRIVHPDDRQYLQQATERTIKEGKPQQVEFRVVRKNGSIRHIWGDGTITYDENGVLVRMIGVIQDITERKRTEDALRQSERQFRRMIEASPVPFALNNEQLNITYINSAFTTTFGYTLKDIPTLADWWPKAYPDEKYRQKIMGTSIKMV